jgi:hypothetical protein
MRGVFVLAAGIAIGCSTSNSRAPASAPSPMVEAQTEAPMRPASAPLSTEERAQRARLSDPDPTENVGSTRDGDAIGQPGCTAHAETTPRGIAVVFTARTNTPDQVRTQVAALAKELELARAEPADTGTAQPASFGTRQIAELSARSSVTNTADGARLIIDADDSVERLRARVLWHMAAFLPDTRDKSGLCPVIPRQAAERHERDVDSARKLEAESRP